MALVSYSFVLLASLPQIIAVVVIDHQSALYRQQNEFVSYGNFKRYPYNSLLVTKLTSFLAEKQSECPFKCVNEPKCYSCNVAAYADSKDLYLCELLATDKYSAKHKFHANATFHHYSLGSPCQQDPCQNNGACIPDFKFNLYHCDCQPGFVGTNCERKGKTCSELKSHSSQATDGSYVIDPDGEGGYQPFAVFCNMTDKNEVGVTVVGHDSEDRALVNGYEDVGSYVRNVSYIGAGVTVSVAQLAGLSDASAHCEQFIKYECYSALMFYSVPFGDPSSWWVSRDSIKMLYWGGATPADSYKCACGVTSPNSCADTARGCNCDMNDDAWREDSGLLTEKSHLPVLQLKFGDTGRSDEEGYHTLGKLKCYGLA